MYLHEAIARGIIDFGARHLFGVVGDGNLFLIDSFTTSGGTYVAAGHEAGAVLMAHGYATSSGSVGVATVTHGPGLTNTITTLVDAAMGRAPILLIAGDTARDDVATPQNIDQREFVVPTGAGFESVRDPSTGLEQLAFVLARIEAESRPYVLNVPIDFWWREVDYSPTSPPVAGRAARPSDDTVEEAVGAIASSRRPLILAGRGAATPAGAAAIQRLSTRLQAPVATTLKGKDAFNDCDNVVGLFGGISQPWTTDVIAASDCIIALGAALNNRTTDRGALLRGKRVVQVDLDPAKIGTIPHVDVAVLGDVESTVDAVITLLDEAEIAPSAFFTATARAEFRASVKPAAPVAPDADILTLGSTLQWANNLCREKRTVAIDGGRFMFSVFHDIETAGAGAWIEAINFGSIGLGLGAAIGAYFGRPDRPVVLFTGDGGFMLGGLTEFSTAVRSGADLVVVVLNDSAYGMEHIQFARRNMPTSNSEVAWPSLANVAKALGGKGMTIHSNADIRDAERLVAERTTPVLLDVKLDATSMPLPY